MNSVIVLILLGCITECQVEVCEERSTSGRSSCMYCSDDCCGTTYYKYCCSSSYTYYSNKAVSDVTIYGALFGTIAGVLILSLIICVCCVSFKKRSIGRVLATNPSSNVATISYGQPSTISYNNNPVGVGQPPQPYTYSSPPQPATFNPAYPTPTYYPPPLQTTNPTFAETPLPYMPQIPGSVYPNNSQPNDASRPQNRFNNPTSSGPPNNGLTGKVLLRLGIMGIKAVSSATSEDIYDGQELSETLNGE